MDAIGVAANAPQTPTRSRISRLACDSAIGRNAPRPPRVRDRRRARRGASPAARAPACSRPARRPGRGCQLRASRISASTSATALGASAVSTSQPASVTSTSSSMRTPMSRSALGHVVRGADVQAGLDGERHARRQRAPLAGALVVARVVHVQAEPVPGAVHVEALVGFLLQHRIQAAREELEIEHALREHLHRRVVRLVPGVARAHFVHRRALRGEHQLVDLALRAAVAAVHREGARDVGGVAVELAARVDQQQARRRASGASLDT